MGKGLKVKEFLGVLDEIAPLAMAAAWDNVGLMVGNPEQQVSGVMLALDPTTAVLEEALACGANTVVTHHPLIFNPLMSLRTDQDLGRFFKIVLENNIAVLSSHSNLDLAVGGVNDVLAAAVGLVDIQPLQPKEAGQAMPVTVDEQDGHSAQHAAAGVFGRYGRLPAAVKGIDFLNNLAEALDIPVLSTAGPLPDEISTVAVCGGSGSDLAETAFEVGAQVLITGEVKHAAARWAEANGFCVVDAGHFATENPVVRALSTRLKKIFSERGCGLAVHTSLKQVTPFVFHQFARR